jgi:hypothetical protein
LVAVLAYQVDQVPPPPLAANPAALELVERHLHLAHIKQQQEVQCPHLELLLVLI